MIRLTRPRPDAAIMQQHQIHQRRNPHMITAEDLKKVTLFAPVPDSELKSIAARAADVRLLADEWLLMEGQAAAFYGLLEGHIDVFKHVGGRDLRIASYGPGDYFGEVPLMLGAPAKLKDAPGFPLTTILNLPVSCIRSRRAVVFPSFDRAIPKLIP